MTSIAAAVEAIVAILLNDGPRHRVNLTSGLCLFLFGRLGPVGQFGTVGQFERPQVPP